MEHIRIAGIEEESIVDGPGIRLVVFTQGCKHNCKGCHNPESHSLDGGSNMSIEDIVKKVKENPLLSGVTISGGEPFLQAKTCAVLSSKVKEMGLNIMTYTGYTFEEIMERIDTNKGWRELLYETDILVDGRFDIDKKSLLLKFKGSKNQRIINVAESLNNNKVVFAEI